MTGDPYTPKPGDELHIAMAQLREAAAAHVESRSNQDDSEAIGRLLAAAQVAAQIGMSLREIAEVIDSGARERVVGAPGAAVTELRPAA
jgi:hypothetical protein